MIQRSSLVEKSRQKPPERIQVVTDVNLLLMYYFFSSFIVMQGDLFFESFQAITKYKYDEDPLLASCGISIEKQLTRIDGRVLEAPKVVLVLYRLIM